MRIMLCAPMTIMPWPTVCDDGVSTTLPASMGMGGGYVPMAYENNGMDGRYRESPEVAPTIMARCGTGGNNVPLAGSREPVFCIMGNANDRDPHNGGNGIGYSHYFLNIYRYKLTKMNS